jgi:hypothetical protein
MSIRICSAFFIRSFVLLLTRFGCIGMVFPTR